MAQTVNNPPATQETLVRSLRREDSPGEGNGNPLQYSCLENPMDGGTWWALKSLLQHHSLNASVLWCSPFFMVQLSCLYMTTGKTIALTIWTFVGKVIALLFNMLSKFVKLSGPVGFI